MNPAPLAALGAHPEGTESDRLPLPVVHQGGGHEVRDERHSIRHGGCLGESFQ